MTIVDEVTRSCGKAPKTKMEAPDTSVSDLGESSEESTAVDAIEQSTSSVENKKITLIRHLFLPLFLL